MTTQTSAHVSQSRGLRGMLAMTAATVALVGAMAVWRPWSGAESGGLAPAAMSPPPAPLLSARSATESATLAFAIVATDEAAERFRVWLGGGMEVHEWNGGLLRYVQVVVAATELDAERIVAATEDVNRIRAGLGLPGIAITDLRHGM